MKEIKSKYNLPTKKLCSSSSYYKYYISAIQFLNEEGSGNPLVWSLFNLVLDLGLLVLLCHQKEIMEKKYFYLNRV